MYSDATLTNHLQTSSSVATKSKIIAEWNLNMFENIQTIGNYKNRANSPASSEFKTENENTLQANRTWYGYTDYDTVVDGGYTDISDTPVTFLSQNERQKSLMSLEDCFKRFRPRSGINKIRYWSNKVFVPVSASKVGNSFVNNFADTFIKPRYYAAGKDDVFKYWSSFRQEGTTIRGIAKNDRSIEDTAPFIVYKNQIPTNKIVVKLQTNVSKINDTDAFAGSAVSEDPFYIGSNLNYKSTPQNWKIETLDSGNNWVEIWNSNGKDYFTSESGWDGYFEISYGIKNQIIFDKYKNTFLLVGELLSESALPKLQGAFYKGHAYLVKGNSDDKGVLYICKGVNESNLLDNYEKIEQLEYGWYKSQESISNTELFVNELDKKDASHFTENGSTVYREFEYIKGLRIVVDSMYTSDTTFDLIELSPRLVADISDIVQSYSVKKFASDLGVTSIPVGQLLASTGSVSIFDNKDYFNKNNQNSILNIFESDSLLFTFINKNLQFKFYEIISKVKQTNNTYKDYYIPVKTLYSDGFPTQDEKTKEVSVELRDLSFYFESNLAPEILLKDASLSFIVATLLDSIGFTNYKFLRGDGEKDSIIPYFMVKPNTTIMEALQNLAIATQTAMFFDEANNFVIMGKRYLVPKDSTLRDTDIVLVGDDVKDAEVNLLTYSSFDTSPLTGWTVGNNTTQSIDTTKKYSGTGSLKLTFNPTNLVSNSEFTNLTGWTGITGTISSTTSVYYSGNSSLKITGVKENIVANPGFETNLSGYSVDYNTSSIARDETNYYSGTASLKAISQNNSSYSVETSPINISPNESYTFSIYVRTKELNTTAIASLAWYNNSNAIVGSPTYGTSTQVNSSGWTLVTVTATSPSSGATLVRAKIETNSVGTTEEVCYFDDAKLIKANSTQSLQVPTISASNASFEVGGASTLTGWAKESNTNKISRSTSTAKVGTYSGRVDSVSETNLQVIGKKGWSTSAGTYNASVFIRTAANTLNARVIIDWFTSNTPTIDDKTTPVSSSLGTFTSVLKTDGWKQISVTATRPNNVTYGRIRIEVQRTDLKNSDVFYLDDAYLGISSNLITGDASSKMGITHYAALNGKAVSSSSDANIWRSSNNKFYLHFTPTNMYEYGIKFVNSRPIRGDSKYKFAIYGRMLSGTGKAYIEMNWQYTENTSTITISSPKSQEVNLNNSSWNLIEFETTAPPNATQLSVSIYSVRQQFSGEETTFFDDASLLLTSETNLISNPGFDLNTAGWQPSFGTKEIERLPASSISRNGGYLQATSFENKYQVKSDFTNIEPGKNYILSFYAKRASGTGNVKIITEWYNDSTLIETNTSNNFSVNNSSWTKVFIEKVAPASANRVRIVMSATKTSYSSESIFYDNVSVVEAETTPVKFATSSFINVNKNNKYSLSIYGKAESSAVNSTVELEWYFNNNYISKSTVVQQINNSSWTQIKLSDVCPSNANKVKITIQTANPQSGYQDVYYDKAVLVENLYSVSATLANKADVLPGKNYVASIWASCENEPVNAKLVVDWKTNQNLPSSWTAYNESEEFLLQTDWQKISINLLPPPDAFCGILKVVSTSADTDSESLFLDEAKFTENSQSLNSNIVNIVSQNNDIYNDGKINYYNAYIQRDVNNIYDLAKLDKNFKVGYKKVTLWGLEPIDSKLQSKNEEFALQTGYGLTAIPLAVDLSIDTPKVQNGKIINNEINFGDGVHWTSRYEGYFYANGEIIKYDAIQYEVGESSPVWIKSAREYDEYYSKLKLNGKMYRTGKVRIYSEPYYVDGNLQEGDVKKHGRGQFGTKIAKHSILPDSDWLTVKTPLVTNYQYLFNVDKNGETVVSPTITNYLKDSNVKENLENAKMNKPVTTIKNFLGNVRYNAKQSRVVPTTNIQASGITLAGPTFEKSANNGPSLNYVKKKFDEDYDTFGARLRILGDVGKYESMQTLFSSYQAYTAANPATSVKDTINASSGGISIMTTEGGQGYYLEMAALDYLDTQNFIGTNGAVMKDFFFYKMTIKDGLLTPELLYSDFKNIIVDSGKFTAKVVKPLKESEDSVYDLAIKVDKISNSSWIFSIYFNNALIGRYEDKNPITQATSTNMSLFVRGSSQIFFENVYAIKSMNKKPESPYSESAEFFNGNLNNIVSLNKYGLSALVASGFLSNISPSYIPEKQIYYEEFGSIMRECAYFNVKFNKVFPALRSEILQVPESLGGYKITGYTATPYGAEFLVFNLTDWVIDLGSDRDYLSNLRINGVGFTSWSQSTLTLDDFFKNRSNPQEASNYNVNVLKNNYTNIKNNRLTYGAKSFTIDSPYIQSFDLANDLMEFLTDTTTKERKSVAVEIFGMPIIRLGDLVKFSYSDKKTLPNAVSDNNYVVYGIEYSKDSSNQSNVLYLSEVV